MKVLGFFLSGPVISLITLFLSVIWMLRDEKDRSRPILVFALVLNLFYGCLFSFAMGSEDMIFPHKYDYILLLVDKSLGLSAAGIALYLQGTLRIVLYIVYRLIIPMMILWYPVTQGRNRRSSLVLSYVCALVAGPLFYAIVPACGPVYAFGANWLHPPAVLAQTVRVVGSPNAFPSLHLGTAFLFVLFAQGKLWRVVSLVFLIATALATLSLGEHYVIDLVAGLAFGCFIMSVGYRRIWNAVAYLGVVLGWAITIRFGYLQVIFHPFLLRFCAVCTVAVTGYAVWKEWTTPDSLAAVSESVYAEDDQGI